MMMMRNKKFVLVPYPKYIEKFKDESSQQQKQNSSVIQTSGEVVLPGRTFTDHVHDLGKTSTDILNRDDHSPEVQLKLFDHLNKMYNNSTRHKFKAETESSIDADKAAMKKEEDDLVVNLAAKALPKTRRSGIVALMKDLLNRNVITIDSKGYLGHSQIASKEHINDFLRAMTMRNLNIDAEMEYFLRGIIAYIPPGNIINPKFKLLRERLIGAGHQQQHWEDNEEEEDGDSSSAKDDDEGDEDHNDWEMRRKAWNGWLRY